MTSTHHQDAAALLARCCIGQTGDGRSCGHENGTRASAVFRDPGALPRDGVLAVELQEELARIAGMPVRRGHEVRVLVDGAESFGAMLGLVRTATSEIIFENFIFRSDSVGRAFAHELRARDAEGLDVRVVHDPAGAVMARRLPIDLAFRGSTVDVRWFNLGPPSGRVRRLGRDHRKLVVADRTRIVAGGICLADPWVGNCVRHCTWRDSALLVSGPAAADAASTFDDVWGRSRQLLPTSPRPHPIAQPLVPSPRLEVGAVPVRIVADLGAARTTERLLERVFRAARREILITNPYFIPTDRILTALVGAAHRGIQVQVLVPGRNNHPLAGLSVEERVRALLDAGVRVYRWGGPMIHAKSVVVDRQWTLVGSSNLDHLSLTRNAELNVEVHGTAVGNAMADLFRDDCRQSTLVTTAQWHARPRIRRFATRAALHLRRWQ